MDVDSWAWRWFVGVACFLKVFVILFMSTGFPENTRKSVASTYFSSLCGLRALDLANGLRRSILQEHKFVAMREKHALKMPQNKPSGTLTRSHAVWAKWSRDRPFKAPIEP